MSDNPIGRLVSTRDAGILTEEDLPGYKKQDEKTIVASNGDDLWAYRNEGKINGIVVRDSDCNLPVDKDELLQKAFKIHAIPHSEFFRLPADLDKYNQLLKDVYDGKATIVDEQKQFDAAKGEFIDWVRYDEICYELNPRYSHLKEEKK